MTRAIFGDALLFLAPFLLFAAYLALRRRNPFRMAAWEGSLSWLVIAGLAVAVAGLVALGLTAEKNQGAFVPTHMENGRVVPGGFR